MKKFVLILALVMMISALVITVISFNSNSKSESDNIWLCQNGIWIKYGNPQNPPPTTGCDAPKSIMSFKDCADLGLPIMESYPRQCRFNDQIFTEDIGNELQKTDLIRIINPRPNQNIISPLAIAGEARGNWFFEASFPVELYDGNNNLLGTGIATAQGDWMTTDFVPFYVSMTFTAPQTSNGTLIFKKDNPSGLPENEDQLVMPILFP